MQAGPFGGAKTFVQENMVWRPAEDRFLRRAPFGAILTFTGVAPVTVPSGLYIWYSLQHNSHSSVLAILVLHLNGDRYLLALLLLFIALSA